MTDPTAADAELARMEAAAKAAEPGPWRHRKSLCDGTEWHDVLSDEKDRGVADHPDWVIVAAGCGGEHGESCSMEPADAAFIASANPKAVLALIDRIRALAAERDALRAAVELLQRHARELCPGCDCGGCAEYRAASAALSPAPAQPGEAAAPIPRETP